MVKFQEAIRRKYLGVFVCRKCKTKKRAQHSKILAKRIICRRCGSKAFRPIKKVASK